MKYDHLFSPIQIRGLTLNNRVMMSGMVTKLAKDRYVTQELIDYHAARAKGGLGLNFIEATSVHQPSSPHLFLSIGSDEYIPGLKRLTDAIHAAGGKAGIQLWQGGLVASMLDPAAECVIPNEVKMQVTVLADADSGDLVFPAATVEKIHEVVAAFGDAARRAVEAGFDCVEIHAAHGYSNHVFLSPAFNQREDEYGGSLENRARYTLECIESIRRNIPAGMPVFMRVVARDDMVENGLTLEDIIAFCKMAKEKGVDAINVSRGNAFTSGMLESPPMDIPRGFNVENAAKIREGTGMITIAVGRINDPAQAEAIIAGNKADMVVMGRAHIADPEFCNKAMSGREEDIVRCCGCNQGCNDIVGTLEPRHITCIMNPAIGREKDFEFVPTDTPKKVLIIGGGIAGIEAAIILMERGHHVILLEASDHLGGQFLLAGEAPRKEEIKAAIIPRGAYAKKLGADIRLSTPFRAELMEEIQPDEVIIATGASPIIPNIPGAHDHNVTRFNDVLSGKVFPTGKVAVLGGGLVGIEVAEYLHERGSEVTIIEMQEEVGRDLGPMRKAAVMDIINKSDMKIWTGTTCLEIKNGTITVDKEGTEEVLPFDAVVLAAGSKSVVNDEVIQLCTVKRIPHHVIGDAKAVRNALDATAEAADLALSI